MYKIEITLTDSIAQKLKARAAQVNMSPEEYAAVSVQQSLEDKTLSFDKSADYVLKKNAELYKRLA